MAYRITPAHDPSVQVEFEVPIKGRKAITFSVPKLQYFPKIESAEFHEWSKGNRTASEVVGTKKLLEIFVPRHYEILSALTDGELLEISMYWRKQSEITLPESSASKDS